MGTLLWRALRIQIRVMRSSPTWQRSHPTGNTRYAINMLASDREVKILAGKVSELGLNVMHSSASRRRRSPELPKLGWVLYGSGLQIMFLTAVLDSSSYE